MTKASGKSRVVHFRLPVTSICATEVLVFLCLAQPREWAKLCDRGQRDKGHSLRVARSGAVAED